MELLKKIVRVIRPGRIDPGHDSIFRRLRLQYARIQRAEEAVLKAQRRADSAWSAVTRIQSGVNERLASVEAPPNGKAVPQIKAGTSLKGGLDAYNSHITGGS